MRTKRRTARSGRAIIRSARGLKTCCPRQLRRIERAETWGDPLGIEALVAETLEDLKMFEYALRRELEGMDPEKLRLSGSDEVPEGWRPLVEAYYRSLSREGR